MTDISGIIVAMVTPLDDNQKISFSRTDKLLDKLLSYEINGIFILGTNGEAYVLTEEEKVSFASHVIEYVGNRTQVFVGTGLNSTLETVKLSKKVADLHPAALSVVTPYFVPPTQEEIIEHFEKVANAVDVPIILYNIPNKTGVNIDPESVKILSNNPNIIGIKDSSGDLNNMQAYMRLRSNESFSVLSGSDSKILDLLEAGGNGAIAATANLLTQNDVNIYKFFKEGKLGEAKNCQSEIKALRNILHKGTTPSALKAAVTESGINVGPAKAPVIMPDKEKMVEINKILSYYKSKKII